LSGVQTGRKRYRVTAVFADGQRVVETKVIQRNYLRRAFDSYFLAILV
jgi:hypothetical protein